MGFGGIQPCPLPRVFPRPPVAAGKYAVRALAPRRHCQIKAGSLGLPITSAPCTRRHATGANRQAMGGAPVGACSRWLVAWTDGELRRSSPPRPES